MRASLIIVTTAFVAALAVGLAAPPEAGREPLEQIGELIGPVAEFGPFAIFALIAVNNVLTTFLFFLLGILAGVPPLLFVILNGYILGAVASALAPEVGAAAVMAGLVPHGVIEIPAALLAAGLGLRVGWEALRRLGGRPSAVKARLRLGTRTYLVWVLPALLVAAVVEAFITPFIMDAVANGFEAAS